MNQFFQFSTKYLLSQTSVTNVGNPQAIASNKVSGCHSAKEGNINI